MTYKRIIALFASILLILAIAGCSGSTQGQGDISEGSSADQPQQAQNDIQGLDDATDSNQSESSDDGSLLSGGGEWPTTKVGQAFPEPQFASKPYGVSTAGDTSAIVYYDNVTSDEVSAYIQTLEDAGYTNNVSESRSAGMYTWSADDGSGDGLFDGLVSIRYMSQNGEHKNDVMLQISVMS